MENNFSCLSAGKGKTSQKKIIIVGAGISGLACAYRLKELGFQDVLILEARSRIGGRIYGLKYGESNFIELGGQWIHGEKNNIVYEIAEAKGLVDKDAPNYRDAMYYFPNFTSNERDVIKTLLDFLDQSLCNVPESCLPGVDVSSYLQQQFNLFTSKLGCTDLNDCLYEAYDWFCKVLLEVNGCRELSDLSLKLTNIYEECDGNQGVELKHGYDSILSLLLRNIPNNWILRGKTVVNVDWSSFRSDSGDRNQREQKKVEVQCENNETFLADHVVVTAAIGYLKKNHLSLFNPPLNKTKQKAIECSGFGAVNKIYLEFEVPFWEAPTIYTNFKFCYEKLLKEGETKVPLGSWVKDINRFAYSPGHPKMLCAWVVGDGAIDMESLSDAEIVSDCMPILNNILGRSLERPTKIVRSSWNSDPLTFGSYSYQSVRSEREGLLPSHLAEPEYGHSPCSKHPVLLFAGEATHTQYFSTVHGAYETGLREAERLYKHYRESYRVSLISPKESIPRSLSSLSLEGEGLCNQLRIVIVGAGLAGLACAVHLTNNGFRNVTILEAQDRVGGRVSTVKFGGNTLELGGQWVHGSNNPLYDYCKSERHVPHITESTAWEGEGLFCSSNGERIDSSLVKELKDALDEAKVEIDEGLYDTKEVKSVGDFLLDAFNSYISNIVDSGKVEILKDIFEWLLKIEIIDNACEKLNDIGVQSFTEWDDCPDEMYRINLNNGFSSVLNSLASSIPSDSLLLKKPVKNITWLEKFKYENQDRIFFHNRPEDKYPVSLEYGDKERIHADSVIVTASVGFLQENIDTFFSPALPERKLKALNKIGFGTVNKIFLVYEKPFWNVDDWGIHLIWKKSDPGKCKQLLSENPWVEGITGFDVMSYAPNVLLGWIGGKEAKSMEKFDDKTVINVLTALLQIFLDSANLPKPSHIFRSSWSSNPYIRGSYSSRTPEFYAEDSTLHDFQYPLSSTMLTKNKEIQWPIVIFSGEATDKNYFSSAHGAFHSGLTAAQSLIEKCSEVQ